MLETILNIYLIINNGFVVEFRAVAYEIEGGDDNKAEFLKKSAEKDFPKAYRFDAPQNERGKYLSDRQFWRLEKQNKHYKLFEEIFSKFKLPENPLVCVTRIIDGKFSL
ncbi:MAG: hypothetical protein K8H86_07490 [Ignavibacteriaceae bacterium]|nr:hypothetical protein [Ignavibacteriaceae bacterium]